MVVDVVGIAREHDQITRLQQVEVGAAAELHCHHLGDFGADVLGDQVRRFHRLAACLEVDARASALAAFIQMAAPQPDRLPRADLDVDIQIADEG